MIAVLLFWQLPLVYKNWELLASVILLASLVIFFAGFERSAVSSREVGVIAVMAALAAVLRVPFAPLPGVQPTTFLVIIAGYVFGSRSGFMVGAVAALVSNFFLGQGPWTPFQMLFWGLAGASAGLLGQLLPKAGNTAMLSFSIAWRAVLLAYAASFPMDTLHALGNACFYLLLGPQLIKVLRRFQEKMTYVEG